MVDTTAELVDGGEAVYDSEARTVSAARVVPVNAETVFDVLARPRLHPLLDGSTTVRRALFGPDRLTDVGQNFGMFMRLWGLPYPIVNTVHEFEEGRRLAWAHVFGHRWRYLLEPVDAGHATRVVEQFDYSFARTPDLYIEKAGFPRMHCDGIPKSLERLEGVARGHAEDADRAAAPAEPGS